VVSSSSALSRLLWVYLLLGAIFAEDNLRRLAHDRHLFLKSPFELFRQFHYAVASIGMSNLVRNQAPRPRWLFG
jgi:hypothetical protein